MKFGRAAVNWIIGGLVYGVFSAVYGLLVHHDWKSWAFTAVMSALWIGAGLAIARKDGKNQPPAPPAE